MLIQALNDKSSEFYKKAIEALGEIGSEAAVTALVKILKHKDFRIRWRSAEALRRANAPQSLVALWRHQLEKTESYIGTAILDIQAHCKFYNYEIFQAAQSSPPEITAQSSPSLIVQGDYIVGDKVEGDKTMGDKVTGDKNIHNVETVGNLNTGTVNVQGDQIGSQNNSDGKA